MTDNLVIGAPLSPGERNVMYYTALGLTALEIGELRGTTHNVVKNQRGHAYTKLTAHSDVEAIATLMATDQGFCDDVRIAILAGDHKPVCHKRGAQG